MATSAAASSPAAGRDRRSLVRREVGVAPAVDRLLRVADEEQPGPLVVGPRAPARRPARTAARRCPGTRRPGAGRFRGARPRRPAARRAGRRPGATGRSRSRDRACASGSRPRPPAEPASSARRRAGRRRPLRGSGGFDRERAPPPGPRRDRPARSGRCPRASPSPRLRVSAGPRRRECRKGRPRKRPGPRANPGPRRSARSVPAALRAGPGSPTRAWRARLHRERRRGSAPRARPARRPPRSRSPSRGPARWLRRRVPCARFR